MSKDKRLRVIAIVGSLILFILVMILTNDHFDELESRNSILLGLSLLQFGIIVYIAGFNAGKKA